MRKKKVVCGIVGVLLWMVPTIRAFATDNPCQEVQDILGLPLSLAAKQEGGGLVVSEVTPLSLGARIGLLKGDIFAQWLGK